MGKNNKKIKSRCNHCNQQNKYKVKNWKGKEKTRCNHCGKFLVKEIIQCKEVKQKRMENQNTNSELDNAFYAATKHRSILKPVKKGKKGIWIFWIIVSMMILGLGYVGYSNNIFTGGVSQSIYPLNQTVLNGVSLTLPWSPQMKAGVCSNITRVPSWLKGGIIIDTGYKKDINIDQLIENNILFAYILTCPACHKQILEFGEEWQKYMDSGLTERCG